MRLKRKKIFSDKKLMKAQAFKIVEYFCKLNSAKPWIERARRQERPKNFGVTIWIKLMIYLGYLFFGSFLFMTVEQPEKEARCKTIENVLFVDLVLIV
jgi:hypothetical protein